MKLVFVAGALDYINGPLCEHFYKILGEDFKYVATKAFDAFRSGIDAKSINDLYPFVLKWYENKEEAQLAIDNADVVIYGHAPEALVSKRMKDGKITFRAAERMYKDGPFNIKNTFHRIIGAYLHHGIYQGKQVYYLCSGAYVANDLSLYKYYKNRFYKWGYFTELSHKSCDDLLTIKNKNNKVELIWTARFVSVKHPEIVIHLAKYLKEKNADFHITMMGTGEIFEEVKKLASDLDVLDYVTFTGSVSPKQVIEQMEKSHISLFTSDRGEGWGAVVNEAMGCGCAVVASSNAGSSPFLINNKENGLLFDINDTDEMFEIVYNLINNKEEIKSIGMKAYNDIQTYWTAENAAKSFVKLAESIIKGNPLPSEKGPCSVAPLLKDGWFKKNNE